MIRDRCKKCFIMVAMTDWRPYEGVDPRIREFKCPKCGGVIYKRLTLKQLERTEYER